MSKDAMTNERAVPHSQATPRTDAAWIEACKYGGDAADASIMLNKCAELELESAEWRRKWEKSEYYVNVLERLINRKNEKLESERKAREEAERKLKSAPVNPEGKMAFLANELEHGYWIFDAMHKGINSWKGRPQSERDAFKSVVRGIIGRAQLEAEQRAEAAERALRIEQNISYDRLRQLLHLKAKP